jgi:AcrR family transcriptional regulator
MMSLSKARREREREEMRQKIMNAARELFATQGYEAVTMRSIAERIEYTPTCIYFHFADKEALLREICDTDFARFAQELQPDVAHADALERIRLQGQLYLEFARKHPNHYRLMFMTVLPQLPGEPTKYGGAAQSAYAYLRQCCAEAIATGAIRADITDPDLVAQTLWAAVHGVASLYLVHASYKGVDWCGFDLAGQTMLEVVFRGLRTEPPARETARAEPLPAAATLV